MVNLTKIFQGCLMRRRRMKVKHLGAIFLFLSLFLYGIVQTLYLLSPALERLSNHIFDTSKHKRHAESTEKGRHIPTGHQGSFLEVNEGVISQQFLVTAAGETKTIDDSDSASQGSRRDHVLRYRVIVDKKHKLLKNPSTQGNRGSSQLQNNAINNNLNQPLQAGQAKEYTKTVIPSSKQKTMLQGTRVPDKRCPSLRRPEKLENSKTWTTVHADQLYVFSAYYESRLWQPAVRIVAVMAQTSRDWPGYCHVWFHDQSYPDIAPVEASMVPEGHVEKRFAVYLLTCRLRTDRRRPYAVGLVGTRCDPARSNLAILNTESSRERMADFTVCVTPLNYEYNNVNQLVEMIETNRLLGARHLVFYNHSTGTELDKYLNSYVQDGIVDVIQWRIPLKVDTWPRTDVVDIHYFGQLAALNDCLYRNMYKSKFVVFSDLDELIVPKIHDTWKDILGSVQEQQRVRKFNKFGAFVFQCVFFRTDWPSDPNATAIPDVKQYKILTLLKTKREKDVFPWGMRSKYIADPLKVEMVGIHNIWRFVANRYMEYNVPAGLGLLHHYRHWEEPSHALWTVDRTLHKFTDIIISRVRDRHEILRRDAKIRTR